MAEKITVYQCPACTGPLHFDGKIGKLKCDYCGSTYTTEEVEALYREKNAKAVDSEGTGWGSDAAHMRAYNCTTCGAELICDDTTAATSCPYCGNPTVIPGKFAGVDRPDYVIPFKVDKSQAIEAFKNYYKGRKLLPGSFGAQNHIEEIKGVYVPFWMFTGEVEGQARYKAYKDDKRRAGDEEITKRDHYNVYRSGSMGFEKIPVDASTKMPDDLMDSIEPFDYKELRPFAMEYMPGYLANKYDVSKSESQKRADERAVSSFRSALRSSVKGYTSVTVDHQNEIVRPGRTDYGMLPVWLLSSSFEGKVYQFAMNGQSGKMIGDLPVSKLKLAAWVAGVFAVIFALFNFLIFANNENSVMISAIIALIVAAITGAVMNGSMKPVARSRSAGAYVAPDGSLALARQDDHFEWTEEIRQKIKTADQSGGGPQSGGGRAGRR